jgi:hypothetical protein
MIGISFDVDWAPDATIEHTLEILDSAGVSATFFATHATPVLRGLDGHEIGIHPNFVESGPDDWAGILDEICDAYPEARGARCHAYHQNSHIFELFAGREIAYDSTVEMFRTPGIRAFRYFNGMLRLPVFWGDDTNWLTGGSWEPELLGMDDPDALYIFDFHPIHIFLNTESEERYVRAKPHYQDPDSLREHQNPEDSGTGARVMLKRLLEWGRREGSGFATLGEMARKAEPEVPLPSALP